MYDEPSTTPVETVLTAAAPAAAESAPADTSAAPAAVTPKEGDQAAESVVSADGTEKSTEVPEEYGEFTMPEGVEVDKATLEKALPMFKELGLTKDQAQKLVDFQAEQVKEAQKNQVESFNKLVGEWQKQSISDKEFGGDKFQENVKTAQLAITKFGNPELKQLMEDHGIGNHPEMVRFMLKVGRTLKEDVPSADGDAVAGKKDRVSILYPQK